MTEAGILKVESSYYPVYLSALLAIAGGVVAEFAFQLVSPIPVIIVLFAVLTPVTDEMRHRDLRRLVDSSPGRAPPRRNVLFDWQTIEWARLKGNKLSFTSGGKRRETLGVDSSDLPYAQETLTARLGLRMTSEERSRVRSFLTSYPVMFVILLVVSQAFLVFASLTPFFQGEEAQYLSLVNSQTQTLEGETLAQELVAIFLNNIQVALVSFVPFLGTLTLSASSYNTGRALQIIAAQRSFSPSGALVVLYLLPHTLVEEVGYPLATALGYYILTHWNTVSFSNLSARWHRGSTKILLSITCLIVLFAFAATLEVVEPLLQVASLYLWVPVLALAYALFGRRSRLRRFFS